MKIKFQTLLPWMDEILGTIKKDIKNDFLAGNPIFCRAHFGNLPQSRISLEDICVAFTKELEKDNDEVADFINDRWVFKHGDIYEHFAERLYAINPDFDQIKELTPEQSRQVLAGTTEAFGARDTYIFSMLNGVVFPASVLATLLQEAKDETERLKQEAQQAAEEKELVKVIERQEKEIAKLVSKHEQALLGVMKKYTADVNALKKQILSLQKGV